VAGYSGNLGTVRADRLLSLLLLLQHRGRMTASALAGELEVSERTVLRDIEALSASGVPVYAERGRHGGFALLPGWTTDLTGLSHDEALALLIAGSRGAPGMRPALASAMRKVVAGLPAAQREAAGRDAERILVEDEGFLPVREGARDTPDAALLATVRQAVFAGRRLRIRYAPRDGEARRRTIDPIGLVDAGGRWYLLATRDGHDRSYRLSRMADAEVLDEPADRAGDVDLDRLWRERRARWMAGPGFAATVLVVPARRDALVRAARAVLAEAPDGDRLRLEVTFADPVHAAGVLWAFAPDVEVREPDALRRELTARARATAQRYSDLKIGG
jgi:predicted DNA-binding transcriptional regulator YafY